MNLQVQEQFEKVVRSPLRNVESEDLKPVALALWHEDYTPRLDNLTHTLEFQKAGYLVDLMSSFSCVSDDRYESLDSLLDEIRLVVSRMMDYQYNESDLSEDELAKEWCLPDDVNDVMPDLLEYQTRHYVHAA